MRVLIQRVAEASVEINNMNHAAIKKGLLLFVGIESSDEIDDSAWLAGKIVNMRIFNDAAGLMNLSVNDVQGQILVVSQFTLHASIRKGNRPSFIQAARPQQAIPLYEQFLRDLEALHGQKPQTGVFGADMKIHLVNDGPVTIWADSKNRV